jgi:DNA-binding MarR family transcriptional regulator
LGLEEIIDFFFENINHLFFPENWLQLDLKFSKSELFTLLLIDRRREITMTELADYISAPMSTANGVAERLVKKGIVTRDRSDADRRIVVLRLSEEGTRLVAGFKDLASGYLKAAMEELSEEEIETLAGIALKIIRGLQRRLDPGSGQEDQPVRQIPIE